MKTIGIFALILVAATCSDYSNFLKEVAASHRAVTGAIQARERDEVILQNVNGLEDDVLALWNVIPVSVNELRELGYTDPSCDESIRRLHLITKVAVSNAHRRRYEVILSDSNYFFQQIDKVDRTCSALEAKIESTVRSNKDQPKCKEAIERVQKAIREGIAKKKGLSRLKNEKQLRIAVLNSCSRVNTK
eukprot:TRINITY_DN13678_c0_g1_i1.p1 TRINITY_DN13678_c0_g1~~TRINITY_DN13678_c0_g1_i1.p1  ORF type:complete len:190 (-),score=49.61 TRINITY_DN13678_c0_g1_i1:84-653(-)